jgi:predicted amidohydrolase
VLSFQLREGFVLRGVMPNYLSDPLSHNFASLVEWLNPDYRRPQSGIRKARIACVQYQMRRVRSFAEFEQQVRYFVGVAAEYRADFVLLPELVTAQLLSQEDALSPREGIRRLAGYEEQVRGSMRELAMKHGVTLIAGSHPVTDGARIYNVAFVCLPSGEVVAQPKLHITPNERRQWGISGGHALRPIDTPKARVGVLICYDVEFPEAARYLADLGAEILFVPFCTDSRQSYLRVRYCAQARAIENQVYVAMAGNVGNLPDVQNLDINYGQAAVLTPSDFAFARDGIAAEADSNEETLLICDVDLNDLHEARSDGSVTPRIDRRADLFKLVSLLPADQAPSGPSDGPLGPQPGNS